MRPTLVTLAFAVSGLLAAPLAAQEIKPVPVDTKALSRTAQDAVQEGDWEVAVASFRKLTEVDPKDARAWHMLGYSLHAQGKLDEALVVHEKAATFPEVGGVASYNCACVHALRGDKEKAIAWLEKAADKGFGNVEHIENDSDMDGLRSDPRFQKVIAKMKTNPAPRGAGGFMVYTPVTERKGARLALFSQSGSPGQLAIDYGPVLWKDSYDQKVGDPAFAGRKWRFGRDYWTSLDSNLAIELGGVKVPAGHYYLTVQRNQDGAFQLDLHDASAVKAQKLDAFQCDKLGAGIVVPMTHGKVDDVQDKLAITLEMDGQVKGELVVRYGPHRLACPLVLVVEKGEKQ